VVELDQLSRIVALRVGGGTCGLEGWGSGLHPRRALSVEWCDPAWQACDLHRLPTTLTIAPEGVSADPSRGGGQGQRVVISPPSITKSAPVVLPARSLARTRTRSATSSGWVNRPVGLWAAAWAATSPGWPPVAVAMAAATPSCPSHRSVWTGP